MFTTSFKLLNFYSERFLRISIVYCKRYCDNIIIVIKQLFNLANNSHSNNTNLNTFIFKYTQIVECAHIYCTLRIIKTIIYFCKVTYSYLCTCSYLPVGIYTFFSIDLAGTLVRIAIDLV